jgi:hypothetical protein
MAAVQGVLSDKPKVIGGDTSIKRIVVMSDYLKRLLAFYWNPRRAVSETLDHSRLAPVMQLAVGVVVAVQAPGFLLRQALTAEMTKQAARALAASSQMQQKAAEGKEISPKDTDIKVVLAAAARNAEIAMALQTTRNPADFRELAVLAGIFVPAAIALIVLYQGLGRCSIMIQREYAPVLLCVVTCWTAARLPLIPLAWLRFWKPTWGAAWPVDWPTHVSTAVFLILAAPCLRTCLGTGWVPAGAGAALGGGCLAAVGYVTATLSPLLWVLASPCLLYYVWGHVGASVNSMGASLSARQSFRHALEATTLNPRDADAHFQLGLIQLQRRNLAEAEARFRQAAEIDPSDADYAFQLGCVLRGRGQLPEALEWLSRAAALNEKTAGYEVWREIGATQLSLGNYEQSLAALNRYVNDREYDPIGLVYRAEALNNVGRHHDARSSYEKALEAITTMPRHRRGELRPWASRAKNGLRCTVP